MRKHCCEHWSAQKRLWKLLICLGLLLPLFSSAGVQAKDSALAGTPQAEAQPIYLPYLMSDRCAIRTTISDPGDDVATPHTDILSFSSRLEGRTFTGTFYLADLPEKLTFDRSGTNANSAEYEWAIFIDLDNRFETGARYDPYKGAELRLWVTHQVVEPGTNLLQPVQDGLQASLWRWDYRDSLLGGWYYEAPATFKVDPQADLLSITADIPEARPYNRINFFTTDYNPAGQVEWDSSYCSVGQ